MADGDRPTRRLVFTLPPEPRLAFTLVDEPHRTPPRDPLDALLAAEHETADPNLARDLRNARLAVTRLTDYLDGALGHTLVAQGNEVRQRLGQLLADVRGISGIHDQG